MILVLGHKSEKVSCRCHLCFDTRFAPGLYTQIDLAQHLGKIFGTSRLWKGDVFFMEIPPFGNPFKKGFRRMNFQGYPIITSGIGKLLSSRMVSREPHASFHAETSAELSELKYPNKDLELMRDGTKK